MSYVPKKYICRVCLHETNFKTPSCEECGTLNSISPLKKENQMEALPLTKANRHQQICENLNEIYRKKNQDYGDSFGQQFAEYGEISAAIRLEDKLKRFKQLIKHTSQVKDESKIDTLLDLANYAIMTVIELEEK